MSKELFPLSKVYGLLEPGPVILLTTEGEGHPNIMTLSWHSMLEFEPPWVSCVISDRNDSFELIVKTQECVINIPTEEIAEAVVQCGNSSGAVTDKFKEFGLTPKPAELVGAPLIDECYANMECKVIDTSLVEKYGLFILEVVKAWVDPEVTNPKTLHHLGYGRFMVAGKIIQLNSKMR